MGLQVFCGFLAKLVITRCDWKDVGLAWFSDVFPPKFPFCASVWILISDIFKKGDLKGLTFKYLSKQESKDYV